MRVELMNKTKTIECPGRHHIGGTMVTHKTAGAVSAKTGVCSWCENRVFLALISNVPLAHQITVTIHGLENKADDDEY